ncbi:ATP-dependent nuclease [Paenibacillus piscarius]|uniref:ATP-dependent nuclease n=1 Tax=Paenibacillus piscarius TaxID=1089681 RepID=UPI001EE8B530|nr:AAA family ATPase [Paenibacillus piscarius]
MRLINVEVKNYRLLHNLSEANNVQIDPNTTLIVGKNNSGKTSFTNIFNMFLRQNGKFEWSDFSSNSHSEFRKMYQNYCQSKEQENEEDFFKNCPLDNLSIEMLLTIEYSDQDNWSNIRPLLTSLDDSNQLKILFSYALEQPEEFFQQLHKLKIKNNEKDIIEHVEKIFESYFKFVIRPYDRNVDTSVINITDIKKIIGTTFIAAQREVDDGNSKGSTKLSSVFQREYRNRSIKSENKEDQELELNALNEEIINANSGIDKKLDDFFREYISSYATFGYPNLQDSELKLKANMTVTNLFQSIRLFYKDSDHMLPEKYNGLGYSNLIYIISEILSFKAMIQENGTDLNLIFVEEPEAHMHPQLQSILIQRINYFLEVNKINAQVIITTHSSHIVSNSSFESIRYFFRRNNKCVAVKDMMKFSVSNQTGIKDEEDNEYDVDTLQFLKRYITLVKCDMFFADKIVMIEGLCERLLMPMFFEKVDTILQTKKPMIKILSEQYISVIEVNGAYMHKFKDFLEFLEVKTLIITDIDCCINSEVKKDGIVQKNSNGSVKTRLKKNEVIMEQLSKLVTTNPTLKEWIPGYVAIDDLLKHTVKKEHAKIFVAYQKNVLHDPDKVKCGRTFEEAFIIDNAKFIFNNKGLMSSISNHIRPFSSAEDIWNNSYKIYDYIDKNDKKSNFAFDLMYLKEWNVPSYIEEGLSWLASE